MRTVKVGMMPGRLVEVAVEDATNVAQVFEIAGIEIPSGYEVRMDGEKVAMDTIITGNLVVATKMIKGNSSTVKVGMMPGRLVELALQGGESVQDVFALAGIEIPLGYEVRMDGEKVDLSTTVTGNLVVATKLIKGNTHTVKVGTMPGRLVEIAVEGTETIAQVFEIAGIELLSGYELRRDGEKVESHQTVGTCNLIVQSKLIKGNK